MSGATGCFANIPIQRSDTSSGEWEPVHALPVQRRGQEIIAKDDRPRDQKVLARYTARFPKINLFSFGDQKVAQPMFFGDGGFSIRSTPDANRA